MVFTKLVVASGAVTMMASAKEVLTPQSLNEQSRSELGKAEVQKIQLITSRMHEVVQKLNGFASKLEEQTSKYLSRDRAELSAQIGNTITATPFEPEDERVKKYDPANKWFKVDPQEMAHDTVVSLTHVGIHTATALATTYLDGLVPRASSVLEGNINQRYVSGADFNVNGGDAGKNWGSYFLTPLRDEISGYMIPSMAKLLYHLIMDVIPTDFGTGERSVWKKEQFRLPMRYPLADTWVADNVRTKDEDWKVSSKKTGVPVFKTDSVVMEPINKETKAVKYIQDPEQRANLADEITTKTRKLEYVGGGGSYNGVAGKELQPDEKINTLPLVDYTTRDA